MSKVTIEHINLILSGLQQVNFRLDKIETRLTGLENGMTRLEERVSALEDRMTAMEDRMLNMENRMTAMEERMLNMENRMTTMEERMLNMEHNMKSIQKLLFDHIEATGEMELEFRKKFGQIENQMNERFDQVDERFLSFDEKFEYLEYCNSDHNLKFEIIIKQINQTHELLRNHDHRLKKLESNHGSP